MGKISICRKPALVSVMISASILLSACGLHLGANSSSAKVSEDIQTVVEDYLDDLQGGTLSSDKYQSDYAKDSPFADLSFIQIDSGNSTSQSNSPTGETAGPDERIAIMEAVFDSISYDIGDTKGSLQSKEGTCDVTITAVDIAKVLSSLATGKITAIALTDAITADNAPTNDYDITFDLSYSSKTGRWIISDTSPVSKILGDPFEDIVIAPPYGDPADTIEAFINALQSGDSATLNTLSPYYDATYFWPENDQKTSTLVNAVLSGVSYVLMGDPQVSGTYADVNLELTMADLDAVLTSTAEDVTFNAQILKPYLLAISQGGDTTTAYNDYLSAYILEVAARVQTSDAPVKTVDTTISLEVNADANAWELYSVPTELYSISSFSSSDPYYYASTEAYNASMALAAQMLFDEGSIDQATYQYYMDTYGGTALPTTDSTAVANDISGVQWYDYATDASVTSYDATITYDIELDLFFNSEWVGLTINYDYYNANGTVLCKSSADTLQAGQNYMYSWYETEDYSLIPADTYRCVVYLEDGTILADQNVTVA